MIIALLLLPLQQNTLDLAKELPLQKEIDLSLKSVHVPQAMKALSAQVGMPVEAVNPLWDLKVTMFCKGESAASMMEGLQGVLGGEWTKDNGVYRLRLDSFDQQHRDAYKKAELRLMRDRVEKALIPFRQLSGRGNSLAAGGPQPDPALAADAKARAFGSMLAAMNSSQWNALWRGEVQTWVPMVGGSATQQAQPDEQNRVIASYDPFLCSFESTYKSREDTLAAKSLIEYARPASSLPDMPFAKSLVKWETEGEADQDARLAKAFVPVQWRQGAYYEPMPTLADQLEAFHRSSSYPVVADSFSVPLAISANNGASLVGQLKGHKYFARFEDGVLQVRHPGFWRLRDAEIPEGTLRSFTLAAGEEPLTLSQYASFAAALTPAQASALTLPRAMSLPFDPQPLEKMLPALMYYGKLSTPQRTKANSGLSAGDLNSDQSRAFLQTMLTGVLKGYGAGNYIGRATRGDFTSLGTLTAEENFEAPKAKKKNGKPLIQSRRFSVYVGSREQFIRYVAEAKGPPPAE